jgi:hypothetical protein
MRFSKDFAHRILEMLDPRDGVAQFVAIWVFLGGVLLAVLYPNTFLSHLAFSIFRAGMLGGLLLLAVAVIFGIVFGAERIFTSFTKGTKLDPSGNEGLGWIYVLVLAAILGAVALPYVDDYQRDQTLCEEYERAFYHEDEYGNPLEDQW